MLNPKPVKRSTIIKTVATVLSLAIVLIFGPRMDGPRIINGFKFAARGSVLTNFGLVLLVLVPISTYLVTNIILKITRKKKNKKH